MAMETGDSTVQAPIVLLTRYSVRKASFMQLANIEDEAVRARWFAMRSKLFKTITYPSVATQSIRPARWYLLLACGDEELYEKYVGIDANWISPIFVSVDGENLDNLCRKLLARDFSDINRIYLSRIDNDDALCRAYFSSVLAGSQVVSAGDEHFVLCRRGCRWDGDKIQFVDYPNGPFISLYLPRWRESNVPFLTLAHTKVLRYRHVFADSETHEASWLQVLHGANASNRFLPNFAVENANAAALERQFALDPHARDTIVAHRNAWQGRDA